MASSVGERVCALVRCDDGEETGSRLIGLGRRASGAHAGLWDLPTAEVAAEDAHAPVIGEHGPELVAVSRAAFVEAGVLLVDGEPTEGDRAALRAAYDDGVGEGHRELGRRGLRWRTAGQRLGVAGGRGDVDATARTVFAVTAAFAGDASGERVAALEERWASGSLHLTPAAAVGLRWAIDSATPTGHGDWEVAPGVRMLPLETPTLPPATHTNCFLVGTGDAVLVEPASPHEREIEHVVGWVEAARQAGVKLGAILTTHHHPDHVGGAAALSERLGVPLWAHRETVRRLPHVRFERELVEGERLELAGPRELTVEAVHTPGHAPGHLCFHVHGSGALLAGDMVAGVGTILIEPTDGDMTLYLASLRAMAAREPSMILPAHGGLLGDPQSFLEHYLRHRLAREVKVRDALAGHGGPARADELVPVAYADAPKVVWPMAALSVESHLRKLLDDGEARLEGGRWTLERRAV